MDRFDFEARRATPEWLTSTLKKNGFLSAGEVSAIGEEPADSTALSTFIALRIAYSQGSAGRRPSSILMKLNQGSFYRAGQREARFYEMVASVEEALPLVTCYGTEESPELEQCCILLDDLTPTHGPPRSGWPAPPPEDQCKAAISALARVHAWGWGHARYREPAFELPERWAQDWALRAGEHFPRFVERMGPRLSTRQRETYEVVLAALAESMQRRYGARERMTLLHGDAHYWNFLYPRTEEDLDCVIVDWQLWKIGPGAFDLSYMIALHGYPDYRREMERPLLRFYQDAMRRHGIDYGWPELWLDYRVSVIFNLLYPLLLCSKGVLEAIWGPHLERGFAAFDDLECMELL